MASVLVPLAKLIDLALCTPEVGAVNFNILHTALLVIVDKLNLSNTNVEFKGSDATKIETLNTVAGNEKTQKVLDYNVTTTDPNTKADVVSVRKPKSNRKSSSQSSFLETSLLVLTTKVDALQAQVDAMDPSKMPHTEQLIEAVRTKTDDGTPIVDIVQQVNLAKRLSAAEHALEQLASLTESLTEEYNNVKSVLAERPSPLETTDTKEESGRVGRDGETVLEREITQLKSTVQELSERIQMISGPTETVPFQEMMKHINEIEDIKIKANEMKKILQSFTETGGDGKDDNKQNIVIKMNDIETMLKAHQNQLDEIKGFTNESIDGLQSRLFQMEREINLFHEKLQIADVASQTHTYYSDMQSGSERSDISTAKTASQGTHISISSRLNNFEGELSRLAAVTESILEEEEKKRQEYKMLSDQVEILKSVKANKLDIEDTLTAKADKSYVHRKVSYDHFDHVLEDLKNDFSNVVAKLDEHEKSWQQDLERLEVEFKEKLDQEELGPLKELVADKLKLLQEKIKALALMRKEAEAAGAKRKFLKDIYCISCDKDVVMNAVTGLEQNAQVYPVQPVKSIRPYLTYKLDQMRKQQTKLPYGRNLLHFEQVLKNAKSWDKSCTTPGAGQLIEDHQHLSNRYCGGSHTITTPQQRVTRIGHHFN